jgi:putative SOS response-associated peptidase YedK
MINKTRTKLIDPAPAVITREAAGAIKNIHHRMPVILSPEIYSQWLDTENQDTKSLGEILNTKAITNLIFSPRERTGQLSTQQ